MRRVLFVLDKLWLQISYLFRTTYTANKCGHKTKLVGPIKDGDGQTIMTMPLAANGSPDYCLDCIGDMSIQCAWCENTITIGSPVTLYTPKDSYQVPDHAVPYTEGGSKALVGCLGWGCAVGGADRAGFWLPGEDGKGHVHRVPTALEILMSNQDAKALIVNDLGSLSEANNPRIIK